MDFFISLHLDECNVPHATPPPSNSSLDRGDVVAVQQRPGMYHRDTYLQHMQPRKSAIIMPHQKRGEPTPLAGVVVERQAPALSAIYMFEYYVEHHVCSLKSKPACADGDGGV